MNEPQGTSSGTPPIGCAELDRFLAHLQANGVEFAIDEQLQRDPDQGGHAEAERLANGIFTVPGLPQILEHRVDGIRSDHATWSVAADLVRHRLVAPGSRFWDIGTGSGVLALAAHALGAGEIIATDVSGEAIATAQRNFRDAGAEITLYTGSLLDAVPPTVASPDLLVANLPHKPCRPGDDLTLAENGGEHGDALIAPFFEQAAARVTPGTRLVFFQHSLPHPRNLARLSVHFDLRLLSWKRRFLGPGEYGEMPAWFAERTARGESYLAELDGARFLIGCVWIATRR